MKILFCYKLDLDQKVSVLCYMENFTSERSISCQPDLRLYEQRLWRLVCCVMLCLLLNSDCHSVLVVITFIALLYMNETQEVVLYTQHRVFWFRYVLKIAVSSLLFVFCSPMLSKKCSFLFFPFLFLFPSWSCPVHHAFLLWLLNLEN